MRFAERTFLGLLFHEPPRNTRRSWAGQAPGPVRRSCRMTRKTICGGVEGPAAKQCAPQTAGIRLPGVRRASFSRARDTVSGGGVRPAASTVMRLGGLGRRERKAVAAVEKRRARRYVAGTPVAGVTGGGSASGFPQRRSVLNPGGGPTRWNLRNISRQGAGAPWTPASGKEPKTQDSIHRPGNSETDVVEPVSGGIPVAERGTHAPRFVDPRAATQHPDSAIPSTRPRTAVPRRSGIVIVPAVLYPLPNVTQHIVHTKSVRRKRTHRRRLLPVPAAPATSAIRSIPHNIVPPPVP